MTADMCMMDKHCRCNFMNDLEKDLFGNVFISQKYLFPMKFDETNLYKFTIQVIVGVAKTLSSFADGIHIMVTFSCHSWQNAS